MATQDPSRGALILKLGRTNFRFRSAFRKNSSSATFIAYYQRPLVYPSSDEFRLSATAGARAQVIGIGELFERAAGVLRLLRDQ